MRDLLLAFPGTEAIWAVLPKARVAGGAVRDALLGRVPADVDFASALLPEQAQEVLRRAGIKTVPTGIAHGTITAVVKGRGFEITTLRRDVAADGRHAAVVFTDDWEADAGRRDFTLNAMSVSRDGVLFDYFGGQADLAAGKIRFVGDAGLRITEDYLRILRFFRFFARYGNGEADAAAVAAIAEHRAGIRQLSAERVWGELKNLCAAADPRAALALMRKTGVLDLVLPGADLARLDGLVRNGAPADVLLRVAALLRENVDAFAARLKLSAAEREFLNIVLRPNSLTPGADEAVLRRALADEAAEMLMARSWVAQDDKPGWDELRGRIAATRRPVFALQGRDVVAAGIMPGPELGGILSEIRDWWMAGGCVAGRDGCLERLQEAVLFLKQKNQKNF